VLHLGDTKTVHLLVDEEIASLYNTEKTKNC